jgi:ubiquinone/menaquinone biosynthesis C-methylase UbiE
MTLPSYAMSQQNFPEMYEQHLVGPLFRPWAQALIERARPVAGERVLDIACGTGIVARLAQQLVGEGNVVAVDISPPMLSVARRIAPNIDWREGSAEALPIGEREQFDLVFCHQGLQFFPDRPAAVQEMRRVLAPGGRLVIGVWRSIEENPFYHDAYQAAQRQLGSFTDQRHAFGDPAALEKLLAGAGFRDIRVEPMTLPIQFQDGPAFVRMNSMALVGMSPAAKQMGDAERARLLSAVVEDTNRAAAPYMKGNALSIEMASNIATARA